MIKTLVIDLPKSKPKKAPRRSGANSLGGSDKMMTVRFGQYDRAVIEQAAKLMELTPSETVRELSLRCAKALCHGPPGSHPFSRVYLEGSRDPVFPDDRK